MSLKINIKKKIAGVIEPVTITDVICRVVKLIGNKEDITFSISLSNNEYIESREYNFTPKLNEVNFISQAYEHLKTLDEYSDAVNC